MAQDGLLVRQDRQHNDTDKDEKAEAKSINENRERGSENRCKKVN